MVYNAVKFVHIRRGCKTPSTNGSLVDQSNGNRNEPKNAHLFRFLNERNDDKYHKWLSVRIVVITKAVAFSKIAVDFTRTHRFFFRHRNRWAQSQIRYPSNTRLWRFNPEHHSFQKAKFTALFRLSSIYTLHRVISVFFVKTCFKFLWTME